MSFASYFGGIALLAGAVASLWFGARKLRGAFLRGWAGPEARLAELVLFLTLLVVDLEVVGSVGEFRRFPVLCVCLITGTVCWLATRHEDPVAAAPSPALRRENPAMLALAGGAALWVLAQYVTRSRVELDAGMANLDSLQYHMPSAAAFVQSGSLTGLHFTWMDPLTAFYPMNSELLHAFGLLMLGDDTLSPVLNIGWLLVVLLAGYAAGRSRGLGSLGLLAVAAITGSASFVSTQAGEATNDLMALALLAGSVALLLRAWEGESTSNRPYAPGLVVSGLAAGLAIGTKLTVLASVGGLTIGLLALTRSRKRGALWMAPLLLTGGFWYLRNLVRAGNPLPWFGLHLGPVSLPAPPLPDAAKVQDPLAKYLANQHSFTSIVVPAFKFAWGPLWPLLFAAALAAALVALARGPSLARVLGAVALVAGIAYVFTPDTGGTSGGFVLFDSRFAAPAMLVAASALLATGVMARWAVRAAIVVIGTLFVSMQAQPWLRGAGGHRGTFALTIAISGVIVATVLWVRRRGLAAPRRPRPIPSPVLGVAALARPRPIPSPVLGAMCAFVALAFGWALERHYRAGRYAADWPARLGSQYAYDSPFMRVFTWAQSIHGARIAVSGLRLQYPLFGADASNEVQYVGRAGSHGSFRPAASCLQWRALLDAGGYRYVLITPPGYPFGSTASRPVEDVWTATDPAATQIIAEDRGAVRIFRLTGRLNPLGCGRAA